MSKATSLTPQIWHASVTSLPEHALMFSEALEDGSAATAINAPPRKKEAIIEAYFVDEPDQIAINLRLTLAATMAGIPAPTVTIKKVPATDWLKKVAADFPPLPIGRWLIYGDEHKNAGKDHPYPLQIDATSAFGTGEHPTTRGSLLLLDQILKHRIKPRRMMDIGCGTGILALAFARATKKDAIGVDFDAPSVHVANRNAAINGLQHQARFYRGMGYRGRHILRKSPTDLIMANIFAGPLAQLAPASMRNLRSGGHLILAGLLSSQANWVLSSHRSQKIYLRRRMVIGEWTILLLKKPRKR